MSVFSLDSAEHSSTLPYELQKKTFDNKFFMDFSRNDAFVRN